MGPPPSDAEGFDHESQNQDRQRNEKWNGDQTGFKPVGGWLGNDALLRMIRVVADSDGMRGRTCRSVHVVDGICLTVDL